MKIDKLIFFKKNKQVIISANLQFSKNNDESIYFATDFKNKQLIYTDYSPFLAAVLLPCMKTGEDIVIDGPVDKKLLENTKRIMDLVEGWDVGLKKIKIKTKETTRTKNKKTGNTASFFSLGVDSFYTYLKHKKNKDKIRNLILIHGFDISLSNNLLFTQTKKIVEKIAKEEKINAIFVETNAGEIVEKHLVWDFAHGGVLAAVGLFLGKGLNKIFIPAGLRKDEVFPYGTHPALDKLWSSGNTQFIHDGTEYNRLGKVLNLVSKSDLALKYLRVCTQNLKGKYNCGKCYKCLQTMLELVCASALDKAKTFPKLDLNSVRNMYYDYKLKYNLQGEENLKILKKQSREPKLQKAIEYSLENSRKLKLTKKIYKLIASWDQKYNNRRLYFNIIKMNKNQDRNLIYKSLMKIGALK